MPTEALVCPSCRTWVEGSGRVVRCPACGTRFRASEARLGARATPPPSPEPGDGRLFADPDRDDIEPVDTVERDTRELSWGLPHTGESQRPPSEPDEAHGYSSGDEAPAERRESERERSGFNPSMLFTAAILLLIFVGNRFLSGEMVIAAIVLLVAAQWFVRRSERRDD